MGLSGVYVAKYRDLRGFYLLGCWWLGWCGFGLILDCVTLQGGVMVFFLVGGFMFLLECGGGGV